MDGKAAIEGGERERAIRELLRLHGVRLHDSVITQLAGLSPSVQERDARMLGLGVSYEGQALDPSKVTLHYAGDAPERAIEAAACEVLNAAAAVWLDTNEGRVGESLRAPAHALSQEPSV